MNLTKFFLTIILTLLLYSGIFKTSLKLTMTTILFPVEIIFFLVIITIFSVSGEIEGLET